MLRTADPNLAVPSEQVFELVAGARVERVQHALWQHGATVLVYVGKVDRYLRPPPPAYGNAAR